MHQTEKEKWNQIEKGWVRVMYGRHVSSNVFAIFLYVPKKVIKKGTTILSVLK